MQTFTIGELAEKAGLPVRTVRYYQAASLLPRAERSGRSLQFTEAHLDRLRQIAELQGRGLKLNTIRAMLDDAGHGNVPVLALLGGGQFRTKWLPDAERIFTVPELAELLGDRYFHLLEALEHNGYLERRPGEGASTWHCPDVPLLRAALELADLGADVELTARARDMMRRRLRRMADDLVEMWESESGEQLQGDSRSGPAATLEHVRAVAFQAAAHMMAQEAERVTGSVAERSASHVAVPAPRRPPSTT